MKKTARIIYDPAYNLYWVDVLKDGVIVDQFGPYPQAHAETVASIYKA